MKALRRLRLARSGEAAASAFPFPYCLLAGLAAVYGSYGGCAGGRRSPRQTHPRRLDFGGDLAVPAASGSSWWTGNCSIRQIDRGDAQNGPAYRRDDSNNKSAAGVAQGFDGGLTLRRAVDSPLNVPRASRRRASASPPTRPWTVEFRMPNECNNMGVIAIGLPVRHSTCRQPLVDTREECKR